jgi:hypothetical protein
MTTFLAAGARCQFTDCGRQATDGTLVINARASETDEPINPMLPNSQASWRACLQPRHSTDTCAESPALDH